ncbi:MAG: hypothetical protein ILM98_01425 [Kiritimatiellae bacterium]|nr:hypothetical protein [Kiritimatiellia bacterium]
MLETALVFDAADTHLCRIDDATPNLRAVLAAPGPLRFSVAPANAWGQEGRVCQTA